MVYDEFKRQLGKAGLTGKEFSKLVKLNPNTLSIYSKAGKVPAHWAIVIALMAEMADKGLDFRAAVRCIQFDANKPRGAYRVVSKVNHV